MLNTGPAKKVTVYVMEGQTYHGAACYAAILDYLFFRGISDATVVRGVAGFGTDHKLHTSRLVELAEIDGVCRRRARDKDETCRLDGLAICRRRLCRVRCEDDLARHNELLWTLP